jgi:dienelactone hydrolase
MIGKISEQAVLLGDRKSLVGIHTRPAAAVRGDLPAIVILNTGIIHRVGHHRMFVTMSRALANVGYAVLRFDFSGIGDSDPRQDGLSPLDACMAEIRVALDWLESDRHASRIILIGLCSGADHAVLYSHTDDRVIGLVLLDPSIPTTRRYYADFITARLTRLRSWVRVVTGRSRAARIWAARALDALQPRGRSRHLVSQDFTSRAAIEAQYQKVMDSDIRILAVLTGETTRQTYPEQMLDALSNVTFGDRLKLEFFPDSDHTFIREADRSKLIRLTVQWIDALTKAA